MIGSDEIYEILQIKVKKKFRMTKKEKDTEKEDNRDIGHVVIEDDMKVQDKKKNGKKKQKSKEENVFEAEVEIKEANEKFTLSKKEQDANICFYCRSPATSSKLSKCRGCQKVIRHLG